MVIDCRDLHEVTSDTHLLGGLARQTGYWPVFTFLNSVNNLIDLASVSLIGQKGMLFAFVRSYRSLCNYNLCSAGLSSSLTDRLQQILDVVGKGLQGVSSSHRASITRQVERVKREENEKVEEGWRRERVRRGLWHDGRLDCVAGNGIMCKLGIGDEMMLDTDAGWPGSGNVAVGYR
jgi:RNA12 protein